MIKLYNVFEEQKKKKLEYLHNRPYQTKAYVRLLPLFVIAHYEKLPVNDLLINGHFCIVTFNEFIIKVDDSRILLCIKKHEDNNFYVDGIINGLITKTSNKIKELPL